MKNKSKELYITFSVEDLSLVHTSACNCKLQLQSIVLPKNELQLQTATANVKIFLTFFENNRLQLQFEVAVCSCSLQLQSEVAVCSCSLQSEV